MEQAGVHTSIKAQALPEKNAITPPDTHLFAHLEQALLLVQHAFTAVALLDGAGRLIWVNEGFVALVGTTVPRLLDQSLWAVLPPNAGLGAVPADLDSEAPLQYEGRMHTEAGTTRWLRVKLQPAPATTATEPRCFFALLEDISTEKATAAATAARDAQLQYLTEQAPGVLFQWRNNVDGTSRLTYVSATSEKLFGYQFTQLEHFIEVVHPEDQQEWAAFLQAPEHETETPTFEGRLVVPGQPLRWCSGSYQLSARDAEGALYSGILTDITSLKTTEEALQDSEYRWLLAIERFGDGGWEFNYQTGDDYFSNAYRAMLGYPDEDFPPGFQSWHNHVHPDDQAASIQASDAYLRGDVPIYSVERRLLCRNGEYKWVLTRGLITKYGPDGEPLIMTGVHTDISEIKRANLAIEASTRRLSTTIANFQEGILLEDENRRVVLVNEAFCRMLNLETTPDQLVGVETVSLLADAKQGATTEPGWLAGRNGRALKQQAIVGELLPRKNGQVFQRDFLPIYSNDTSLGYLWKFQDVTEQKNAEEALKRREEKYRRIIEQMKLGLVETNLAGEVVYVNQVFCDTLGVFSTEVVTQEFLATLLAQETSHVAQEEEEAYELPVLSQDGSQKWLQVSRALVYDDDKQLIGTIRITLDITHQKQLENKLRRAKEQAEDSSRAKESFLANMSHEIRTPMNAILGMSQLLSKTPLRPDQDDYLRAIATSGENLLVIINDILDLSKIEAGQLQVEQIGFSASQLLTQIEKTLLYKAEEKGLSFVTEATPELPKVLLGDPYRITQVLLNLAGNAIKFTEKGLVSISCELIGQSADAVEIKFTVADTGIGIAPAYLSSIFQEFTQEDSSVTRKFGGTGLGLSISRSLVNLMGGELHITSEKNKGTVSTFSLFLLEGEEVDLPRREAADPSLRERLRGKEVLLVEDNKFNRQIAKALLNNVHIRVEEAENGALAVEMLRSHRYDLVLMDVQMPIMNGLEATTVLRQELSLSTPIIALTANAIKGEREKCLAAGMNDYLAKPFQEDELLKLIGDWVLDTPHSAALTPPLLDADAIPDSSAALYKLDLLYQIGQGDEEFVALMLETFVESCQEATHDLSEALRTQDARLLKATTHKLKPSLDHLHAYQLLPLITHLDTCTGPFDLQVLEPLIENAIKLLHQVINQMTIDLTNRAAKKAE
ncbi:PAS domain S-box protein [Hymenobacter tibetensis]|uniref:histidine kinase n=1 Tax=Hymenobacter tibetensis TaxID=497967 RepID=A0ABY4CTJ7_9BACT|nr:PAS domain-containing hybrid sensor histidine kinase/response regulator [Hymenobacter tibetensis]UOG73513.1 PAS domain S-box protein [Hymenobacter tibetensis]